LLVETLRVTRASGRLSAEVMLADWEGVYLSVCEDAGVIHDRA
jgi:hypothetical protein